MYMVIAYPVKMLLAHHRPHRGFLSRLSTKMLAPSGLTTHHRQNSKFLTLCMFKFLTSSIVHKVSYYFYLPSQYFLMVAKLLFMLIHGIKCSIQMITKQIQSQYPIATGTLLIVQPCSYQYGHPLQHSECLIIIA